jgi:L-asparaginase
LTGSQRPLGEIRSDARRNLVDAVDLATRDIPEVGVCFDGRLLRGNRATKGDAWSYTAFASPNCPPLARLGLDVEIAPHVRRPGGAFSVDARFDASVAVCFVTPAMAPRLLDQLGEAGAHGVVLAAFGVGNVPARPHAIAGAVRALVDVGVTVAVVTQAHAGGVDLSLYANGVGLRDAGALAGGDMGIEAAVAKLMAACARFPADASARARYFLSDVAGERGDGRLHLAD